MRIVGVGASAGGMEALASLLSNLPANTGAAFVLIQHFSPDHESILDQLLARYTRMPIEVVDEYTRIEPNHIYLISKDKNLTFDRGMLVPHRRLDQKGLNLPIDLFFHSLGEQLQEKAIGVILSGTGTDGSRGARTIKETGGMVLVQSPDSARFDGMPNSVIRLQLADRILPPEELAQMLVAVLKRQNGSKEEEFFINLEDDGAKTHFERILNRVSTVTGVDFSAYREATLNRRLNNRILLHRFTKPESYYDYLCKNESEALALHKDFLIGVTRFFRNPEAFAELEKTVLPRIFQGVVTDNTVRIWVPGCSTGEEAYSLALIIARYLHEHQLDYDFKIFGTDVDSTAIRLAAEGVFPYSVAADIPADLLVNYFTKENETYRIKPELRDRILFAVHNLLADPPFIHMHLISCRNLLIYFKSSIQRGVLSTFHFVLNQGGYLMLGPSESLGDIKHAFVKVNRKWNIFQKKEDTQLPLQPRSYSGKRTGSKNKSVLTISQHISAWEQEVIDEATSPFTQYLVDKYVPPVIFITPELNIAYIHGDLDPLLTLPRQLALLNLHKMLEREIAVVFQNGVNRALSGDKPVLYRNVVFRKGEEEQNTHLRFRPVQLPAIEDPLIMVEIIADQMTGQRPKTENISKSDLLDDHVRTLEQELKNSRKHAQKLVGELEATNEELQASNRELLAANEELQSTNEELQSVNEELYTVNVELQSKNEDLTIANDDINNLLRSTEIGTIFLDADLSIRKFTPAIRRQFHLIDADVGRSITNFSSAFEDLDIAGISRRVFETLEPFEQEVSDIQDNHYLLRILPYRTENDRVKGLVITFVDVDELVTARRQSELQASKFRSLFEYSEDVIIVLDQQGRVSRINHSFGNLAVEGFTNTSLFEQLPEDIAETLERAFTKVYSDKSSMNLLLEWQANGNPSYFYDTDVIPVTDQGLKAGSVNSVLLLMKDVTNMMQERQQMEDAIAEYQSFMDSVEQQIALVNSRGIIRYINYTQYTGISKEDMIGTSIYDYLSDTQHAKVAQVIEEIFAGQASGQLIFDFTYQDGSTGQVELIATPVIINQRIKYVALIGPSS